MGDPTIWCGESVTARDLWAAGIPDTSEVEPNGVLSPTFVGGGFGESYAEDAYYSPSQGPGTRAVAGGRLSGNVGCPQRITSTFGNGTFGAAVFEGERVATITIPDGYGGFITAGVYSGAVSQNGTFRAMGNAIVHCGSGWTVAHWKYKR
jgi:hypothetical protein